MNNLLLMKHKSIYDWIVNSLVIPLKSQPINELSELKKESQYRSSCSPLFCRCFKKSEAAVDRCSCVGVSF